MRLEAITLHGFKSFAEKTVVKILPGITGIVGPNGCGKSNLGDAVRWALGEQSAKSLRGEKMEYLIFHGTGSRKPVGLAEVELLFSNDGTLSVPWSEIAVARRLYRTGESEYLLNKQPTRLRDILDMFAGTGANPRAYSVMDQDKLNHVLTAKPHERRVFIEEAAGIARYKQQRTETQGKLDAARQNLVRVRDVMDEVRRQLGSLERQARKAQQYKALQGERRELALTLVAADFAGLTVRAEALAQELTRLGDAERAVRARLAGLAAREAGQREQLQASEHRLADLRQSVQKIQGELERLLERREQMGVQLQELAEDAVRIEQEVRLATERLETIVTERETALAGLAEAEHLRGERGADVEALQAEVEGHRAGLAGERDRLEALRLEQVRVAAERVDLMRQAGELRERQAQLGRRRGRLAQELAEAQAEMQRLTGERAALESARDLAVSELSSLAAERERLAEALADRESRLAEAEGRLAQARLDLASRSSSRDAVRELEVAREGYGAGVRAVFAETGAPAISGVVGTVADLLEVEPGLERPVEAVLGERLQWVVVERFEHARAAVAWLREQGSGSATFVPLEPLAADRTGAAREVPPASPQAHAAGSPELRWATDHVNARAPGLVQYLLGQVAVVEHLDAAEALWRRNGVVATYVTPAGEVLSPTGRLRGGSEAAAPPQALLTRKRQLRDLEAEVGRLTQTVDAGQAAVAALGAEVATLRARLSGLEQSVRARQADHLAGEKDLEQSVREHERVHRHLETLGAESRQVGDEAAETESLLARLAQHIQAASDAETRHDAVMAAVRAAIEGGQETETALVARLTAGRVELAGIVERAEALGRELSRLDEMEADFSARIEQGRQRQGHFGERRAWLAAERERTDASAREVALERDRREEEARRAGEEHQALADGLRALEEDTRAAQSEASRLVAGIHELELKATEGRVRREELAQEAYRTYGVEAARLPELHDPDRDLGAVRERLAELEARLEAIGPVNLVADEEYRELDERLTFLRAQHDDLTGSIKDLEKALRGMTRTAQERFSQAFEEINRHFGEIFGRLFEGGRAELRLVEAEEGGDPLDTGVELMAQPRGKRLQAVSLMSGGERALTGLALLFAIFYFRPSPFCVLDEVDAPLDDANIHRFLRVLRELTSQTQFLVITHNRHTMEAADILYGVTMEEPGLSKVVSVNLAAAVAATTPAREQPAPVS
jgi:chromosome segregation protein